MADWKNHPPKWPTYLETVIDRGKLAEMRSPEQGNDWQTGVVGWQTELLVLQLICGKLSYDLSNNVADWKNHPPKWPTYLETVIDRGKLAKMRTPEPGNDWQTGVVG